MEIFKLEDFIRVLCHAKGTEGRRQSPAKEWLKSCLEILAGNDKGPEFQAPNASTPFYPVCPEGQTFGLKWWVLAKNLALFCVVFLFLVTGISVFLEVSRLPINIWFKEPFSFWKSRICIQTEEYVQHIHWGLELADGLTTLANTWHRQEPVS